MVGILGLSLEKLETFFWGFLAGFVSFKAKYQVNGRVDWSLFMGHFILCRFPTRLENLPDHVGLPRWPGDMVPTLTWRHPCSNDDQSPCLILLGLRRKHNPSNTNKNLSASFSRCRILSFMSVSLSQYTTSFSQMDPNHARESMED